MKKYLLKVRSFPQLPEPHKYSKGPIQPDWLETNREVTILLEIPTKRTTIKS